MLRLFWLVRLIEVSLGDVEEDSNQKRIELSEEKKAGIARYLFHLVSSIIEFQKLY